MNIRSIILSIVTTNGGWFTRLALKYTGIGLASLSAYLTAHNVSGSNTAAITAGIGAAVAAGIEHGLSWIARRYTVPAIK